MLVFRVFQIRLLFIFLCHLLVLFFFRAKPISGGPNPYTICSSTFTCGRIKSIPYPFWSNTRPDYCGHPDYKLICRENADPIEIQIAGLSYRVIDLDPDSHTLTITRTDLSENHCKPRFLHTSMDPKLFLTTPLDVNLSLFDSCSSSFISSLLPYKFSCDPNCDHVGCLWVDFAMTNHPPSSLETTCPARIPVLVLKEALRRALHDTSGAVASAILGSGFEVKWTADVDRCSKCVGSGGTCGYSRTSKVGCCFYPNGRVYPSRCMGVSSVAGTSPESSVTANGRKRGKINWGRKIGIAVGAAGVGVGLTCLAVFIYHRRRKRRQRFAPSSLWSRGLSSDPSSSADFEKGSNIGGGVPIFTYTELEEATSNFDSSKELGDGGYGTVYYGKLQDGRSVAVKRLYENNCRRVEQFMNEVKILTGLRHKNLVSLYGCTSRHSRELLLVYEYVSNGTLADHLHGERANTGSLTWPLRMSIAVETASALMYLHASGIIHRDVKTNNILLDNNFCVKVADFGLSRLFPADVTHVSTLPQGTPGYVDPEYHQCYQLTDRSDVYSFGVVLVELISSMPAVDITRHRHEINLSNLAVTKIQNHTLHELVDPSLGFHRDAKVKSMIEAVAELAFQCLQSEKEMRPSMEEVVESLKHASCLVKPGDGDTPEANPHLRSPDTVTMSWVSRSTTPNSSG